MEYNSLIYNRNKILYFTFFLFCLTLYFVAIGFLQPLKTGSIILIIISLLVFSGKIIEGIYLKGFVLLWLLTLFPIITSLFYTVDFISSLQFSLIYFATIFIFVVLANSNFELQKYTLNLNYYLSVLIMFITLISLVLPGIFQHFFLPVMNEGAIRAYFHFFSRGELSGISGQTGTNAYLLTVGLAFLIFKRKSLMNIILLCLFIVMIIMSAKRGIVLANIVAFLSVFLLFMRFSYKKLMVILMILIVGIISVWGVISNNLTFDINELSSGRISLYKEAIILFENNFLGGTGINTFSFIIGIDTHNVYIQLLSEVGIIGLLIYVTAQIGTLVYTLKLKPYFTNKTKDTSNYYFTILYFQIFFIIYSFMGNPLYDYNFFFIYLLLIAPLLKLPRGDDLR